MCGIVGFCDKQEYSKEEIIKKMSALITHRGPDSDGFYSDGYTTLGFRRLSIIDLKGGDQPIHSQSGRFVIVFNGEIYNYRELKHELCEQGRTFKTDSDTEVILACYEAYGKEAASKLRGMFAFVIYDKLERKLYGARDYFGIKPFYYANFNGAFMFGSEIKSFLAHPKFKKEINKDALKMYLEFQYSPLKECIFKNVYKLTPGHYFEYDVQNDSFLTTAYFTPEFEPDHKSYNDNVEAIDEAVLSSVEYHQIADVEVGSFLSGGVDSSYIASTVKPMKTYSVGFDIGGFDETSLASSLSAMLNMPNKTKEITPDEFFSVLGKVQYHSDEPHANLSAVPLYFLSQMAAKDLKVVLSGEGADEFFGGYDLYIEGKASHTYKKLPLGMRKVFAKAFSNFPVASVRRFFENNTKNVEQTYIGQAFIMGNEEADSILKPEYASDMTYQKVTETYYNNVKNDDDLTKKMYLDMNLWLVGDILLKADKMTMAHSLELRVPYLDREVWRVASTIKPQHRASGRKTKRAFRVAANRHIPDEWAKRKKAGFMVPFRVWIKEKKYSDMVREVFNRDYASEFFNTDILLSWLDKHYNGEGNYARRIYTVYSFLLWYEQYFILR